MKDGTEVEHVQPKSRKKTLAKSRSNFLLACKRCNTRKGCKPVELDEHVWPDQDNTLLAFEYRSNNEVVVNPNLSGSSNMERAQRLLELVGLDHAPKCWMEDLKIRPSVEGLASGTQRSR